MHNEAVSYLSSVHVYHLEVYLSAKTPLMTPSSVKVPSCFRVNFTFATQRLLGHESIRNATQVSVNAYATHFAQDYSDMLTFLELNRLAGCCI